MSCIDINDLTVGYGNRVLLRNLNLAVEEGEMICMIGENGTGKSTLLRTIAGLHHPLHGIIKINGKPIDQLTNKKKALQIALVLTERINAPSLTTYELVAMGRIPHTSLMGELSKNDKDIITTALEQTRLIDFKDRQIAELSDGERQRAVIAKALAQNTPIVLLDEPTSHLDVPSRIDIMLLIKRLAEQTHKTFILITHELELALQISSRIWLLNDCNLIDSTPQEIVASGEIARAFKSPNFHFNHEGKIVLRI